MRKRFCKIPDALQKQIITRIAVGMFFLVLFFVILIISHDFWFSAPCAVIAGVLSVSGIALLNECFKEHYIAVSGICTSADVSSVRRKLRAIYLDCGDNILKVPVRQKIRHLYIGDTVTVYISSDAPVYESDGSLFVCSYHALEIRRHTAKKEHDETDGSNDDASS